MKTLVFKTTTILSGLLLMGFVLNSCQVLDIGVDPCDKLDDLSDELADMDVETNAQCRKFKDLAGDVLKYAKKCDEVDQDDLKAYEFYYEILIETDCEDLIMQDRQLQLKEMTKSFL